MICPSCKHDLIGEPIPEDQRHYYGGVTHFGREIGLVENDYIERWLCPDCGHEWPARPGPPARPAQCDFCSTDATDAPAWRYPAETFIDPLGSASVGDWFACDDCAELIEARQWGPLSERILLSPTGIAALKLGQRQQALDYAREFHRRFMLNRNGPRVRLGPA